MTLPVKKSYDYVIVGAGSAGCVLAAKLTEKTNMKLEKQPFGSWPV